VSLTLTCEIIRPSGSSAMRHCRATLSSRNGRATVESGADRLKLPSTSILPNSSALATTCTEPSAAGGEARVDGTPS
jgi:hypothetical protein